MQVPLMADTKQRGMGLLCPECKSMSARLVLNRKTGQRECRKLGCGYFELNDEPPFNYGSQAFISERKNKQIIKSGGSSFELKDKVCKKYCRCDKCFATRNEPDSVSFWRY